MSADIGSDLQHQVLQAVADRRPLCIVGGGSKGFYGRPVAADVLSVAGHRGIISYEPTELVLTARAGTPLAALQAALAEQGQFLPFEPPSFAEGATLGGTIAGNFSGPRRAYAGAARDFVLGCRIINGNGEILSFGGQVMKNVAGYDVARLMAGSLGSLGVLLEISLKVLPRPELEHTRVFECDAQQALDHIHRLARRPLPLTASCHDGERLWLRLSGTDAGVKAVAAELGGECSDDTGFWERLREQQLPFFAGAQALWRLSLSSSLPPLQGLPGRWLYEWGGAQRWLSGDPDPEQVFRLAREFSGHATLFRDPSGGDGPRFQPLAPALLAVHRRLKQAFDPAGIFNPGKLHADL